VRAAYYTFRFAPCVARFWSCVTAHSRRSLSDGFSLRLRDSAGNSSRSSLIRAYLRHSREILFAVPGKNPKVRKGADAKVAKAIRFSTMFWFMSGARSVGGRRIGICAYLRSFAALLLHTPYRSCFRLDGSHVPEKLRPRMARMNVNGCEIEPQMYADARKCLGSVLFQAVYLWGKLCVYLGNSVFFYSRVFASFAGKFFCDYEKTADGRGCETKKGG